MKKINFEEFGIKKRIIIIIGGIFILMCSSIFIINYFVNRFIQSIFGNFKVVSEILKLGSSFLIMIVVMIGFVKLINWIVNRQNN